MKEIGIDLDYLLNRVEKIFKNDYEISSYKDNTFLVLKKLLENNQEHPLLRSLYLEYLERLGEDKYWETYVSTFGFNEKPSFDIVFAIEAILKEMIEAHNEREIKNRTT